MLKKWHFKLREILLIKIKIHLEGLLLFVHRQLNPIGNRTPILVKDFDLGDTPSCVLRSASTSLASNVL